MPRKEGPVIWNKKFSTASSKKLTSNFVDLGRRLKYIEGMLDVIVTSEAGKNLDAMTQFELLQIRDPVLGLYAVMKCRAIEHRCAGRLACARSIEDALKVLYKRLPKEYQW